MFKAPIIFATLKKQRHARNILIEKHVKLEKSKGPDADSSINTKELKELITSIRKIEKMEF